MLLTSVKNLRESLGEMDQDDVTNMLTNALKHTTSFLEGALESTFTRNITNTNIFHFTDTSQSRLGTYLLLRLHTGFTNTGDTFEIKLADNREDLDAATALASTDIHIDYEIGAVTIFKDIAVNTWAKVTFGSGYSVDTLDTAIGVPGWLTSAALGYASAGYKHFQQLNTFNASLKYAKFITVVPPDIITSTLTLKSRWKPTAFDPVIIL